MKKTSIIVVLGVIYLGIGFLQEKNKSDQRNNTLISQVELLRPEIDAFMAGEKVNAELFFWYDRAKRRVSSAALEQCLRAKLITEEEYQAFLGAHLEVRWSRKEAVATTE